MRRRPPSAVLCRFVRARRAGPAVEFALMGVALFAFLLAIINLGELGFSLGALARGVQGAARQAAVTTAASYFTSTDTAYTAPSASTVAGYFDTFAQPPLPTAGTTSTSNPEVSACWVNNTTNATTTEPPGLYVKLTATYKWTPLGMNGFGPGVTLTLVSVATVMGTNGTSATITATPSC